MKKNPVKPAAFTAKQEAQIRKLRKAGKAIKAIAKELHISDKRVSALFRPETLPAVKVNPPCVAKECPNLTDQVCALRSKGLSIKGIAKKLHKSDKKVAAIVKKTGIGAPAKKPNPPKGVPGFDVIKIELNKDQQFALFVAAHIMELADEINKVIAKVFNKGN